MKATRVDVSWDDDKRKWLIRVTVGEEVVRRHCDRPRDADDSSLRQVAETTASDEGYQVDQASIFIHR